MQISEYNRVKEEKRTLLINKGDTVIHKIWGLGKVLDVVYDSDIPFATN